MYFESDLEDQQDINTMAVLALRLPGVTTVVGRMGCTEDSPAIRRVLAEREVLSAAQAWVESPEGAGDDRLIEAVDRLWLA